MSAPTPGPWARVKPLGSRYWTLGRIRNHVAEPLEGDADWRVAEAAPDLLESLRACHELLVSAGIIGAGHRIRAAEAAIAKAEGDGT